MATLTSVTAQATVRVGYTGQAPVDYNLAANYPNPFNPSTTIRYSLAEFSQVKLVVYNILGQEIQTLVQTSQLPGKYTAKFDGTHLPSGVYIADLSTGKFHSAIRMVLLK